MSINTILHERQLEEYYCALCYAVFDLKRHTVTLSNSGIPYPIRVSGDVSTQIESPGVPLGSFFGVSYDEVSFPLSAGDTYVFCSDGVFEAMNKYKGLKDPPKELYKDEIWSVDVPYPLPSVGAKVKITGHYGYTFGKSSTGIVSDPVNGVATYGKIEYVEQAPNPVSFKNKKI